MNAVVSLYSETKQEIANFLKSFNDINLDDNNILEWKKEFENPIEIADIIGVFIEKRLYLVIKIIMKNLKLICGLA